MQLCSIWLAFMLWHLCASGCSNYSTTNLRLFGKIILPKSIGFTSPLWGNFIMCQAGNGFPVWRVMILCAYRLTVCAFLIFVLPIRGEHKTEKPETFRFRAFYWSEWRDLNSRPLDPQSSARPTALHPVIRLVRQTISFQLN